METEGKLAMHRREVEASIRLLRMTLREEVGYVTVSSKEPMKFAVLENAVKYRLVELGEDSLAMYDQKRFVSSFIISRSIFETGLVMMYAVEKMKVYMDGGNVAELDSDVMKLLLGNRLEDAKITSRNILSILQWLDRHVFESKAKRLERIYGWYSEYVHPNSTCIQQRYSEIIKEEYYTSFGERLNELPARMVIHGLRVAITLPLGALLEFDDLFPEFVKRFEMSETDEPESPQ